MVNNKIALTLLNMFHLLYITVGVMVEINSKHLCVVDFETAALTKQVSSSYRRGNGGKAKLACSWAIIKSFFIRRKAELFIFLK